MLNENNSGFQLGESAPTHYQAQVEKFMAPVVSALVADAVRSGDRVLDVACGTGFASRAAALIVGPTGRVVGTDLNPGMLTAARTLPFNGPNITWQEASALDLPFGGGEFDAVICQQGVQFFPSPSDGLREMARVLRRSGRLAVTVWDDIERNPFFAAEVDMLVRYCEVEPDAWSDAFPGGGEHKISKWFEGAGLKQPRVEVIEEIVSLPPPSVYVPEHLKALPWPSSFFEIPSAVRVEAIEFLDTRLDEYTTSVGIDVPFRSYLASVAV